MTRGFDRRFTLLFLVMLTIAAGNTALQSVLPALGRSLAPGNMENRPGWVSSGSPAARRASLPSGSALSVWKEGLPCPRPRRFSLPAFGSISAVPNRS